MSQVRFVVEPSIRSGYWEIRDIDHPGVYCYSSRTEDRELAERLAAEWNAAIEGTSPIPSFGELVEYFPKYQLELRVGRANEIEPVEHEQWLMVALTRPGGCYPILPLGSAGGVDAFLESDDPKKFGYSFLSHCGCTSCKENPLEHGIIAGYCSYHTPCQICGELAGPVNHYAMSGCKSGGLKRDGTGYSAHCTCDCCF